MGSYNILCGGVTGTTEQTHATWVRFRGICRPMCGSDMFWMQRTFRGSDDSQKRRMAIANKIEPYDCKLAFAFTDAISKWWSSVRPLVMPTEPESRRKEVKETKEYISGFQGRITSTSFDADMEPSLTSLSGQPIVPYCDFLKIAPVPGLNAFALCVYRSFELLDLHCRHVPHTRSNYSNYCRTFIFLVLDHRCLTSSMVTCNQVRREVKRGSLLRAFVRDQAPSQTSKQRRRCSEYTSILYVTVRYC